MEGKRQMITEIHEGPAVFTTLAGEWDAVAARGVTDTPFQTLAYQASWWRNLRPENGRLQTIAVRNENKELIAIAPLYLVNGVIHFNGCVEETDYLDIIAPPEYAEAGWTAVFEAIMQPDFPEWHTAKLCNIPEASPSITILHQIAKKQGIDSVEEVYEVCPIIPLPDTFEEYLANLDSKQRREIKRKLRRAHGAEAKLVIVGADDDLETAVNEFLDLLQKSTYEKREWLHDGRRAIFHETAQAAMQAGTLQLMFIEIGRRKAATLFNFDYKNRIFVYNSGLDPEAFGQLSLGVVLTAKAIEWAIEHGRSEFDFLRGNETYKYRFGAKDTNILRITLKK
jgi:CelD/BcsL family acetyltransferase involved in cellulose biosynthesis